MKTWIFPLILIVLDVLAAGCYGCNVDWRKLIYWLSAAVLTASVTFQRNQNIGPSENRGTQ